MFINRSHWAVLLGNSLTKYDQALFVLLAPVWAPALFSQKDAITALMLTYSLFLLDWIIRPVGAYIFGWIGDQRGRQRSLYYSLMGIVLATALMSILPLFSAESTLSPVLLVVIRWLQNFCAAGEAANGAVLLLENTVENRRNKMSSVYDMASTAGLLCASVLVALLGRWGMLATHWPWLFRIASFFAVYGLWLRAKQVDVVRVEPLASHGTLPLMTLLMRYRSLLMAIMAVSGFSYTTYTVAFVLLQGYLPLVSTVSYQALLELNIILVVLDIILLPIGGYLATRFGYKRQMLSAAIGMVVSLPLVFGLMQQASFNAFLMCRIWIVMLGVLFSATYHAWVQAVTEQPVRCRVASLGYTLGSRLVGMPASVVSLWFFQKTGLIAAPVFYLGITAIAAAIALFKTKPVSSNIYAK